MSSSEIQAVDQELLRKLKIENSQLKRVLEHSLDRIIEEETVGRVFHDFNNILASSMGYATLASARASKVEDEKLHRYLSNIERASIRSRDLVRASLLNRKLVREVYQTDFGQWCCESWPGAVISQTDNVVVAMSSQQLSLCFAVFDRNFAELNLAVDVVKFDALNCSHCGADLHGEQWRIDLGEFEPDSTQDALDVGVARRIVAIQQGHFCEIAMQKGQFVVYLKSVMSDETDDSQ